jgi:hypothetical protein
MLIDILARRWGGPNGGRDGMSIGTSFFAQTLAEMGHHVRCYLSEGTPPPWRHPLVEWRPRAAFAAPDDWSADLVITTIAPAWRRTVIEAEKAGAKGRLIYWHRHGELSTIPGHGCILARVADTGEPAQGWARQIILPSATWASSAGGERTGQAIVVPGLNRAKGGLTSLAVARILADVPWYVLPGRATDAEIAPWKRLGHVDVALQTVPPEQWLSRARVVLLPTEAETYGLAMVEAAVRGIPVVCSDLPGPRYALKDTATYLPLKAAPAEWAKAVRAALACAPRRLHLAPYRDVVAQALGLREASPSARPAPLALPEPQEKAPQRRRPSPGQQKPSEEQRPAPQQRRKSGTLARSGQLSVAVAVTTYERPEQCLDLLCDLAGQDIACALRVEVYQDGGGADYAQARQLCKERGWRFTRRSENAGKRGYWRLINEMWGAWRATPATCLVQLADDFRLLPGGLRRLLSEWDEIDDGQKAMLNPLRDSSRVGRPCWTGRQPERCGNVDRTGWNDCTYLTTPATLEALGWALSPIPTSRWDVDPLLSSGVGEQVSKRLSGLGLTCYQTGRSIVDHCDGDSRMNPRERSSHPLRALGYGPVFASLASIPSRVEALRQVVASLLPQVDRLRVYLNSYLEVPAFLVHHRVEVARSQDHGDRGDAGKFFWAGRDIGSWQLHCDDDLVYPPDWTRTLVECCERYGRRAAISAHGAVLGSPIVSYYRSRTQYHCLRSVAGDTPVHVLGTGALCYHSSTMALTPSDFHAPNMADIWFALAAQRQQVPCVVLAHQEGWLRDLPETRERSIHRHSTCHSGLSGDTGDRQTEAVKSWSPWRVLSPDGTPLEEVG